jgi:hypothetical protein
MKRSLFISYLFKIPIRLLITLCLLLMFMQCGACKSPRVEEEEAKRMQELVGKTVTDEERMKKEEAEKIKKAEAAIEEEAKRKQGLEATAAREAERLQKEEAEKIKKAEAAAKKAVEEEAKKKEEETKKAAEHPITPEMIQRIKAVAPDRAAMLEKLQSGAIGINARYGTSADSMPPLYSIVSYGGFKSVVGIDEIVRVLLARGADVDASYSGRSALDFAMEGEYSIAVIQLLIDAKADVNQKNASGYTPLHAAVFSKNVEAAKLLLAKEADRNVRDQSGWSQMPLQHAKSKQNYDEAMVKLLSQKN